MNKHNARFLLVVWLVLVLFGTQLLTGCGSRARVGELQTETQSVELGDAESVRVIIEFGAGNLEVSGGAEQLMDAEFTYNVDRLKPEVEYTNDTLAVRQPDVKGLPVLQGISGFTNDWNLSLNNGIPMDLSVDMGAGIGDLQLSGLTLTGLDINLGASETTIDLSDGWARDLDVSITSGATAITVVLPKDVGVRVEVETGPVMVDAQGLTKDGNVYTNTAYGASDVTLRINLEAGIGQVFLEVEE